jgi:DNA-directed RNA polymerase specialized sigma24 family protein
MDGELRSTLVRLVRHKFSGYPNVALLADDIVNDAYVRLRASKSYEPGKEHYGDFSFAEIARINGLKLNTVLSHHRWALGKLRPQLTKLLGYGKDECYD